MERESSRHGFYYALEGVRGLAAVLVAVRHMQPGVNPLEFNASYLAVDLFFLLSGFVLASSYEDRLRSGIISARRFALLRLVRLYPLYIAGSLIGLAPFVMTHGWTLDMAPIAVNSSLFLPSPLAGYSTFPFNGPAWSLFLELAISLLYGLVLIRLSNPIIMALAVCAFILVGFITMAAGNADFGSELEHLAFGALRTLCSFSFGVMLFRYLSRSGASRVPSGNIATIGVYGAVIGALAAPVPAFGPFASLYALACIAIVFPAIVALAARAQPYGRLRAISVWLGTISFPLYAIHSPLYDLANAAFPRPVASGAPFTGLAILLAAIVLSRWLATQFDAPVRAWLLRKALPQRRTGDPAQAE